MTGHAVEFLLSHRIKPHFQRLNFRRQHPQQRRIMGASFLRKIVGAMAGAVTGCYLASVKLGSSVVTLLSKNIPTSMKAFIETALAKGIEILIKYLGRGVTGGVKAGAAAAAAAGQVAACVILGAPAVGSVGGAIIGWEAAEDADSMSDAMMRAIDSNFKMAEHVIEKVHQMNAGASKANKM